MSHNGSLVASGQRGNNSDILIWDFASGKIVFKLSEHDHEVCTVRFSRDDRLLYSCGDFLDKKMFIWDMKTGNIVASCGMDEPLVAMSWGTFVRDIKWRETQNYRFAEAYKEKVMLCEADVKAGHVRRELVNIQGVKREFTSIVFTENEERFLMVGTTSADFFVIDHKNKCLHAKINIGSMGIWQIVNLGPDSVLVGTGNGVLASYKFDGKNYTVDSQLNIKYKITSLSTTGKEILVGTVLSQALIVSRKDMQPFLLQESHNAKINCIRFKDEDDKVFGVASDDGSIRLWDASNWTVKSRIG